ncbi:hypothetical protein BSKO_06139 [Bryopsis sp. KO-2023]|nr:hypothetical protein BSKO_06139 [Bryopsis sp. KO-2023]
MWKTIIWKALFIVAVSNRALSTWTETQCNEKALALGIGLLTDPPCQNFMEAVLALGQTTCPHIAKEHRQTCYETYAPTFGEYLANCKDFYAEAEDVSSQSVDETYDPCFTTEQYIDIYVNALGGSNAENEEGSNNDKEKECLLETMSFEAKVAEDPDCSTFFDSFEAETCEIAEEKREHCWEDYGEGMITIVAKCFKVFEGSGSFEESLEKDGVNNACYDEDTVRSLANKIVKKLNGAPIHGVSLLMTSLSAVIVFCVLLL